MNLNVHLSKFVGLFFLFNRGRSVERYIPDVRVHEHVPCELEGAQPRDEGHGGDQRVNLQQNQPDKQQQNIINYLQTKKNNPETFTDPVSYTPSTIDRINQQEESYIYHIDRHTYIWLQPTAHIDRRCCCCAS